MFDFLKKLPGMKLGDITGGMMGPSPGEGGWQTTMQKEGSPFVTTPGGAFAGFNPSVGNIGQVMVAASEGMPGGAKSGASGAFSMPGAAQSGPGIMTPRAPMASATPQPGVAPRPQGSWIERLMSR